MSRETFGYARQVRTTYLLTLSRTSHHRFAVTTSAIASGGSPGPGIALRTSHIRYSASPQSVVQPTVTRSLTPAQAAGQDHQR